MTAAVDMIGRVYGRLTIIRRAGSSADGKAFWNCTCTCGKVVRIEGKKLRSGHTRSCGCFARDRWAASCRARATHGEARVGVLSAEYRVWNAVWDRCTNRTTSSYPRYGGRGIKVCRRWKRFEAFLADMGRRPTPHHSIERENNNLGYSPRNCVWATRKEQQRNRHNNRMIRFRGERATLAEWAERTGLLKQTIRMRLAKGWSVSRALSAPLRGSK